MPSLNDPVPSFWSVIESEFVFVNLTSMSHMSKQNFVLKHRVEWFKKGLHNFLNYIFLDC